VKMFWVFFSRGLFWKGGFKAIRGLKLILRVSQREGGCFKRRKDFGFLKK